MEQRSGDKYDTPTRFPGKRVEHGRALLHQRNEDDLKTVLARERSALAYKFVRLAGAGWCFGAIGAAILDYPNVAAAVLGLGIAMFVSGVAGAWWNKR